MRNDVSALTTERPAALHEFQNGMKTLSDANYAKLRGEIEETGFSFAVHAWRDKGKLFILDGHQRVACLKRMVQEGAVDKATEIPVVLVEAKNFKEAKRKCLAAASQFGEFNIEGLKKTLSQADILPLNAAKHFDFPTVDFTALGAEKIEAGETAKLSDKFLAPPFSVLDARQGYWKERKRQWLAMGIQSEVGRGENLLKYSDQMRKAQSGKSPYKKTGAKALGPKGCFDYEGGDAWQGTGTSIFDPVLCELAYRWFSPVGGAVLDPFAGGSVRGIVAGVLNRSYFGVDLREEQVLANRAQAEKLKTAKKPAWAIGDSKNVRTLAPKGFAADLIFSCPPYGDLEVYSDLPADLSNMEYPRFVSAYREIIAQSCSLLKPNRFAIFVVGDIRDKRGNYRNFVGETVKAFQDAGLELYNEGILVTSLGSLPLRVGRQFAASRKLGKTHQNVLVFLKGDAKQAVKDCGDVEIADLKDQTEED
jgi:hypothetical protein